MNEEPDEFESLSAADRIARLVPGILERVASDPILAAHLVNVAETYLAWHRQGQTAGRMAVVEIEAETESPAPVPTSESGKGESGGEEVGKPKEVLGRDDIAARIHGLAVSMISLVPEPGATEKTGNAPRASAFDPDAFDLGHVEECLRLKARGCLLAGRRWEEGQNPVPNFASIDDAMGTLIQEAESLQGPCYLWMAKGQAPVPQSAEDYEMAAGTFENAADALSLVARLRAQRTPYRADYEAALDLLAEAHSALRVAVKGIDGEQNDSDQIAIHKWLKMITMEEQIMIERYMKLADPADPNEARDFAERLEQFRSAVSHKMDVDRRRKKLAGKIKQKSKEIQQGVNQWESLMAAMDEAFGLGLQPSNVELREALLPLVDLLPDTVGFSSAVLKAFEEADKAKERAATEEEVTNPVQRELPHVLEVRDLLAGRKVLFVGGDPRPERAVAIEAAFDLAELIWLKSDAHTAFGHFEPHVSSPDVALVLLAIRFSSHSYGPSIRDAAAGKKPVVILPSGYSLSMIAHQILNQAGNRMKE